MALSFKISFIYILTVKKLYNDAKQMEIKQIINIYSLQMWKTVKKHQLS
jgi:hypothetical protein